MKYVLKGMGGDVVSVNIYTNKQGEIKVNPQLHIGGYTDFIIEQNLNNEEDSRFTGEIIRDFQEIMKLDHQIYYFPENKDKLEHVADKIKEFLESIVKEYSSLYLMEEN